MFLNINRPRAANVDLYWRVVEGGSNVDIATVDWTVSPDASTSTSSPQEPPINDNPAVFEEIQYSIDPLTSGDPPTGGSFGTMQFKIVLRSTNSSTVPQVKDFRAIAST